MPTFSAVRSHSSPLCFFFVLLRAANARLKQNDHRRELRIPKHVCFSLSEHIYPFWFFFSSGSSVQYISSGSCSRGNRPWWPAGIRKPLADGREQRQRGARPRGRRLPDGPWGQGGPARRTSLVGGIKAIVRDALYPPGKLAPHGKLISIHVLIMLVVRCYVGGRPASRT